MPLDFNRIATTVTGYVSHCHTYIKGIETANLGKIYTKVLDGLNYYLVGSVAKPALQKVSEWGYTKRAIDLVLNNKKVSIVAGAGLFVLFVIWLHPSGKPSRIEGEGGLSKAPSETGITDELEEEEIEESDEEGEVDGDDNDEVEGEEGVPTEHTNPPNNVLFSFMVSGNEEEDMENGIQPGRDPYAFLITPENPKTDVKNPTSFHGKKTLCLDEEGNRIDIDDEEGDVNLDDDDQYEKHWLSRTSTTTAKEEYAQTRVSILNISKNFADDGLVGKGQGQKRRSLINPWNLASRRNHQGYKNITSVPVSTSYLPPTAGNNVSSSSLDDILTQAEEEYNQQENTILSKLKKKDLPAGVNKQQEQTENAKEKNQTHQQTNIEEISQQLEELGVNLDNNAPSTSTESTSSTSASTITTNGVGSTATTDNKS
ncbi:MAG TPA: hypothetical protein VFU89_07640 [Rhabdochlamydiaceae bacterium]|nr:hypothetical protein [Rhabdochlamydiaceae bacterium]